MNIHRMTAVFGRLDRETLNLGPGLNVLQAPNETGKSTWCAFLLSMLYGVNSRARDRGDTIADKNRFAPWSGAAMSGRLDCLCGASELTLTRDTVRAGAPMGAFRAIYSGTGDEAPGLTGQNCGEALLGVSREVFERSAFIRQAGLAISQDAGLERRIASLITSGEENTSFSEAADALKKQLNRRRHNQTGQLPALEEELASLRLRQSELEQLERQLGDAREGVQRLEEQEAGLTGQLRQYELHDSAQRRQALLDAQRDADAAEQAAAGLRRRLEEDRIPGNDVVARLRGAIVNLETTRRAVDKARADRDEAMKTLLRAETAVNESLFAGQTAEGAQKEVQSLLCAHRTSAIGEFAAGLPAVTATALLFVGLANRPGGVDLLIGLGVIALGIVAGLACRRLYLRSGAKARTAALVKRFGLSDPAEISGLAEAYAALLTRQEEARTGAAAAKATADSLYAALSSNEQAILLEVRRFAPAAFDIPTADALLRQCAVRRRELTEAETRAREAAFRRDVQRQQLPDEGEAPPSSPLPEESREVLTRALAQTRQALSDARSAADRLAGQRTAMGDPAALSADAEALEARRAALEGEYAALALALTALDEANTALQTRFSPALGRRTAEIFSQLTDGCYTGVTLDRTLRLSAEPAGDPVYRDIRLLSAGAADQLYLAARLAICQLVLPENRSAPLVLDDALANFDDVRCHAALRWLRQEAEGRQILLFTCHSREAAFFRDDPAVSVQVLTGPHSRV